MAEGATRTKILTRTVPFVGSSLAYYNGGIDAIVLQLKETGGICAQAASARAAQEKAESDRPGSI